MKAIPNGNGTVRKWTLVISCGLGFLMLIGALMMSSKALIEDYAVYRLQTESNTKGLVKLQAIISHVDKMLPQEETTFSRQIDDLQKNIAVLQNKMTNNNADIRSVKDYQNILRAELKQIDQTKLNKVDFWRQVEEDNRRLEYLEKRDDK